MPIKSRWQSFSVFTYGCNYASSRYQFFLLHPKSDEEILIHTQIILNLSDNFTKHLHKCNIIHYYYLVFQYNLIVLVKLTVKWNLILCHLCYCRDKNSCLYVNLHGSHLGKKFIYSPRNWIMFILYLFIVSIAVKRISLFAFLIAEVGCTSNMYTID